MRLFCEKVTEWFYQKGLIQSEDKNALRFSIELLITQLITLLSILMIGYLCEYGYLTIIYCIWFVWARKILDGYHAKSFLSCYIMTIGFFIGIMILHQFNGPYVYLNILSLIMIIIYIFYHQHSIFNIMVYLVCYSMMMVISYHFRYMNIINLCSLTLFFVLCVSNLGGKCHEYSSY